MNPKACCYYKFFCVIPRSVKLADLQTSPHSIVISERQKFISVMSKLALSSKTTAFPFSINLPSPYFMPFHLRTPPKCP